MQVGFSAKCTSPTEDFKIENWECHMFDFRLIPLDRITYAWGKHLGKRGMKIMEGANHVTNIFVLNVKFIHAGNKHIKQRKQAFSTKGKRWYCDGNLIKRTGSTCVVRKAIQIRSKSPELNHDQGLELPFQYHPLLQIRSSEVNKRASPFTTYTTSSEEDMCHTSKIQG